MLTDMMMQTRCDNGDAIDAICARARACVFDISIELLSSSGLEHSERRARAFGRQNPSIQSTGFEHPVRSGWASKRRV